MKVIMILDQVQSGYGTKNDKMIPLTGTKEIIGPGVIMKPYLKEIDGNIVATLYCGTGTYLENPEEVSRKLCGMVKRLNPDVVICGPSLSYADSASMCAIMIKLQLLRHLIREKVDLEKLLRIFVVLQKD